ncbi:replication protein RepO [Serratia odorifera]|uniref:replication protein RepO n=1 Tax=Serratia odorifera TaxID=618 RepID=UPI00235E15B5|nr:replication protein RepO [Serratia odorifera]
MSRLLINENPLQVLPTLARAIGLNEAIVLQQIHYWMNISQNVHDGRRWVYNSVPSWQAQFPFWSGSTVKRALANLEKLQMVHTANYNSDPWDKTKWYSVNYESLAEMEPKVDSVDDRLGQIEPIECAKVSQGKGQNDPGPRVKMTSSPTENTTETTTEIPPNPQGDDADAPGKPPKIKYQDVADAYNEILGDRLPKVQELNEKRKRQIKRLLGELHEPTLNAVKAYFETFRDSASPFYFGDNNRSWRAGFDYLLRSDVLVKTREEAL